MGESVLMDVGKTGTYGAETLANRGREAVVLDRIAFLDRTPGLELVGPLVMHVRTKPGVPALATGFIRQYPPPHEGATLHRVAGFRISPHRSWKDDAELLYYLGEVHHKLKQWNECKEALERALTLDLSPRLAVEARRSRGDITIDCSSPDWPILPVHVLRKNCPPSLVGYHI